MKSSLTLNYSSDGVEAAADHLYEKETYEKNRGYFHNVADRLSGTVARNDITLAITPPKISATFYGTARTESVLGQGFTVETPTGIDQVKEGTIKTYSSIPAGVTAAEKTEFLNRFRAWVASDDFKDLITLSEY